MFCPQPHPHSSEPRRSTRRAILRRRCACRAVRALNQGLNRARVPSARLQQRRVERPMSDPSHQTECRCKHDRNLAVLGKMMASLTARLHRVHLATAAPASMITRAILTDARHLLVARAMEPQADAVLCGALADAPADAAWTSWRMRGRTRSTSHTGAQPADTLA